MLSAAVSAGFHQIDASYEVSKIGQVLDWLNLMAYDLHGDWDPVTGHNTPMADDGGINYMNNYSNNLRFSQLFNSKQRSLKTNPYLVGYHIGTLLGLHCIEFFEEKNYQKLMKTV